MATRLRVFLAAALCTFSGTVAAETITVFAAASLKEALDAVVKQFEAATGHRVAVSYAASNALAKQIEAGAPAAIFVSADTDWIDFVEQRGLALPGSRINLLGNDIVLVAPTDSKVTVRLAPGVDLSTALGGGRLALANPVSVPAGKYAKAALVALGAWERISMRIAPAENVRAALSFVARGESPLGIVYRTDALAEKGVRIVDTFPASSHPPITYPLVLLKGATRAARELAAHLSSESMRPTWRRFGFRTAP
jgi:molybdate transport system substrate-binding protein